MNHESFDLVLSAKLVLRAKGNQSGPRGYKAGVLRHAAVKVAHNHLGFVHDAVHVIAPPQEHLGHFREPGALHGGRTASPRPSRVG